MTCSRPPPEKPIVVLLLKKLYWQGNRQLHELHTMPIDFKNNSPSWETIAAQILEKLSSFSGTPRFIIVLKRIGPNSQTLLL
jgi:hypothetical protein